MREKIVIYPTRCQRSLHKLINLTVILTPPISIAAEKDRHHPRAPWKTRKLINHDLNADRPTRGQTRTLPRKWYFLGGLCGQLNLFSPSSWHGYRRNLTYSFSEVPGSNFIPNLFRIARSSFWRLLTYAMKMERVAFIPKKVGGRGLSLFQIIY